LHYYAFELRGKVGKAVEDWSAIATIGGAVIRVSTDLARIRRETRTDSPRKVVMSSYQTTFNHVGLCVTDRERSRRFYEGLLAFQFWWELDAPDDGTDQLLQLERPVGLHATYLVRDGLVLELLDYSGRSVHAGAERVMDEVGLTHISISVSDLVGVLGKVAKFGGAVVDGTVSPGSAMIRDPDGQLLELLSDGWLAALPHRP
jgi:lactoylglutathione lyase